MLVEFVLGKWFRFDMEGFTQQQITTIHSYERLLIELGEKSYVDEDSQLPVEVRLLGMVVLNAALFVVSKMIFKRTGSNILNMINAMNANHTTTNAPVNRKKHRMAGPNIDLSNLPEI